MRPPRPEDPDLEWFASCAPGLEPLLAAELVERALPPERAPQAVAGGVTWRGPLSDAAGVNTWSALASHVLVRLATFRAHSFPVLDRSSRHVPWVEWLTGVERVAMDARARKSKLYHTGGIVERVAGALCRAVPGVEVVPRRVDAAVLEDTDAGEPVRANVPDPAVLVRIVDNLVTVSLDVSGRPLHRRGYRLRTGKAPLREDLAAALVRVSGWSAREPLVDPFAGAGTVVLEAARFAAGIAPGGGRSHALERIVGGAEVMAAVVVEPSRPDVAPVIASDRDQGVITGLRENAERAGVADLVESAVAPLSAAPGFALGETHDTGCVVTNPPYGRRVGTRRGPGGDLRSLHQTLGRLVRERLGPGWRCALLGTDRRLLSTSGLSLSTAFLTTHGGLKVRALVSRRADDDVGDPEAEPSGVDTP